MVPAFVACILSFCRPGSGSEPQTGRRPGVLEPRITVTLSSEFALPVTRVRFRPGESFRKGEALVEFDAMQPKANLAAAEAAEKAALANLRGVESLAETRQVTEVEVELARHKYADAGARRVAAERELAAAVLAAPFSGRVAERHINDHEWAARGAPLLTIIDDTQLEVRFILPETAFATVRAGTPLQVFIPAAETTVEASVSRRGALFDAASRTFDIWATVDNSDGLYRAGMTAVVELPAPLRDSP